MIFSPAPGNLRPHRRVYAIGDIHGCANRLTALQQLVARDMIVRPNEHASLIYLGDYVDRGPDSAGVLDRLIEGFESPFEEVVILKGNHEEMALRALKGDDPQAAEWWLAHGGSTTLRSWGIPETTPPAQWSERVPERHLRLMESSKLHHVVDGYLFVHAGISPGSWPDALAARDLLWIREPFLGWNGPLGRAVVHGHTPEPEPVIRPNRIGIDTGAGRGGRLTCAVLERNRVAFLSA